MLEIVNSLSKSTQIEVENFLIFLGIYEDRVREKRLKRLLRKNLSFIKGKIGVEAGAGSVSYTHLTLPTNREV